MIKTVAKALGKNVKGIVLFGKSGLAVGTGIGIVESKSKIKILDKISIDVFGGKNLKTNKVIAGVGVMKKLVNIKDLIDVGAGVFATKPVADFLNMKVRPDFSVGISGSWKF